VLSLILNVNGAGPVRHLHLADPVPYFAGVQMSVAIPVIDS
jgi:hypothetical protein